MTAAVVAAVALMAPVEAADPVTDQRLANIDGRLTRLEGIMDNKVLLEMLRRIEALQREVQTLRDATDRVGHGLEEIKDRQRELYLDTDRRLRALETAKPAATGEAPVPSMPKKPADDIPPLPAPAAGGGRVTGGEPPDAAAPGLRTADDAAYRSAFNLLKEGRYKESIAAFSQFLKDYPQSNYAANAQYWLAEANYVSGDFEQAAAEFNKVIEQYPASSKVPDAKLKLGFTHYELQRWDQARAVLSELNQHYPNTTVAKLAENRLERMDREGH